jgi:hypothetical protein
VLKRALLIAASLTLITAFAPVFAQAISEEIFLPAGFNPFDVENLVGEIVSVPCTDGGFSLAPLPDGAEGFALDGIFLQVEPSDLCRSFNVPLRQNVPYKAVYVEFDMYLKQWVTPIFHNIASLRRTAAKRQQRVLYYGFIIRGDNRKSVLDLGAEKQIKAVHPWKEETQYHVVMEVNRPGRRVKMDVFQDGNRVFGLEGKMTARDITNLGGDKTVKVDFSSGGIAFHAYFPPRGWTFANLKVTAVP